MARSTADEAAAHFARSVSESAESRSASSSEARASASMRSRSPRARQATTPTTVRPTIRAAAVAVTAVRCRFIHRQARTVHGSRRAVTGRSLSQLSTSSARSSAEA